MCELEKCICNGKCVNCTIRKLKYLFLPFYVLEKTPSLSIYQFPDSSMI